MDIHPYRYYEFGAPEDETPTGFVDSIKFDLYAVMDRAGEGVIITANWDADLERYRITEKQWNADSYLQRFAWNYWKDSIHGHIDETDCVSHPTKDDDVVRGEMLCS